MKKFVVLFSLLVVFTFFGFADNLQEFDYLLFKPNSASLFENRDQAAILLDNMAYYLISKRPMPKQIIVYGYAANFANAVDGIALSKDRAYFVINELRKRGVPAECFADPVGCGSVNTWGSNTAENSRVLNRRVRVVLSDNLISTQIPEVKKPNNEIAYEAKPIVFNKDNVLQKSSRMKYMWPLLLLVMGIIILMLLLFLVSEYRKSRIEKAKTIPAAVIADKKGGLANKNSISIDLEEEISLCANELHTAQNNHYEGTDENSFIASNIVCPRYQAKGFTTRKIDGRWLASRPLKEIK